MSLIDIYVRDKYTGRIHRVGDDVHDSFWVDRNGTLLAADETVYSVKISRSSFNMQNGDGCTGYHSVNQDKEECGFEFVPMMDGELDEPYATQYKAQQAKAKEWEQMVEDLRKRVANPKPEPVPDDL